MWSGVQEMDYNPKQYELGIVCKFAFESDKGVFLQVLLILKAYLI